MNRAEFPHNFIRFGMQRKRDFLRDFQSLFDGLIIPANILLYQYKSTPLLVHVCKGKPFAIDPMTYLFGRPSFDFFMRRTKEGTLDYKPSFKRLLQQHALASGLELKGRQDVFGYLGSDRRIRSFVEGSIELQRNTVLKNFKEYAIPFLEEPFEEDDYLPNFIISPYFYLARGQGGLANQVTELTMRVLREASKFDDEAEDDIYAMLLVDRDSLTNGLGVNLATQVAAMGFPGNCLWVEDFREQDATRDEVGGLIQIVKALSNGGRKYLLNMYGGFFSMLLFYFGLGGIAHGTLYSESRAIQDTVRRTAGPILIRYYIPALHQFFTLQNAVRITSESSSLLCRCQACARIVRGNPANIAKFQDEEELAEFHFLLNRANEKAQIGRSSKAEMVNHLRETYREYASADWVRGRGDFVGEPVHDMTYLQTWARVLTDST